MAPSIPVHSAMIRESLKISNGKFQLIDINTGEGPNFAAGPPTFIHFHVSHQKTMNTRFNLFLDSSDKLSNTYFPANTPADFCIKLPERLEFNKRWEVALKNIFIGNDLFNMFLGIGIITTISFLLIVIAFKNRPPTPPSRSAYLVSEQGLQECTSYLRTMKSLLTNIPCMLLAVCIGMLYS